jgi:hypothetical protein
VTASDLDRTLRAHAETLRMAAEAVTHAADELTASGDVGAAAKALDLSALNAISTALALARKVGWLEAFERDIEDEKF